MYKHVYIHIRCWLSDIHRLAKEAGNCPFTVCQKWSNGKQQLLIITHGRSSITKVWEQAPQRRPKNTLVTWLDIEFHSSILDKMMTMQLNWLAYFNCIIKYPILKIFNPPGFWRLYFPKMCVITCVNQEFVLDKALKNWFLHENLMDLDKLA